MAQPGLKGDLKDNSLVPAFTQNPMLKHVQTADTHEGAHVTLILFPFSDRLSCEVLTIFPSFFEHNGVPPQTANSASMVSNTALYIWHAILDLERCAFVLFSPLPTIYLERVYRRYFPR